MNDRFYTSRLLSSISGIEHGVTTRGFGDARKNRITEYVGAKQIHGSQVALVGDKVKCQIPEVDGLVTKIPGIRIGVRTADCVPILMVDTNRKIISAVHAGWKGIVAGVIQNAVGAMVEVGAKLNTLSVFIGPHISGCCYTVNDDRAVLFHNRYRENGIWHIDIGAEAMKKLIDIGVPLDQIDAPMTCTSCQNDLFFSYRKDSKETFGEMLSFIEII